MQKQESTGDQIYSGVSTFGVIITDIKTVFGIIIGIIMVAIGIYLVRKKPVRTSQVAGVVTNSPNCIYKSSNNANDMGINCPVTLSFTASDGKKYNSNFTTDDGIQYKNGDQINIFYDPNDPKNNGQMSDNLKGVGWFLIVLAILIVISSIIWVILVNKYKPVAAFAGGMEGLNLLGGRGF